MDKIISVSNKTGILHIKIDGRDKFTKALQYGCRFVAWSLIGKNEQLEKRFRALFSNF